MNYLPNSTIFHLILFLSHHPLNSPIKKKNIIGENNNNNNKKYSEIYHLTNDKRKKLLFFKPNNTIFILCINVCVCWRCAWYTLYTLDHKNVPSNNKTKDLLPVHYSSKQQQSPEKFWVLFNGWDGMATMCIYTGMVMYNTSTSSTTHDMMCHKTNLRKFFSPFFLFKKKFFFFLLSSEKYNPSYVRVEKWNEKLKLYIVSLYGCLYI